MQIETVGDGAEEEEESAEDRRRVIQVLVEMHSLCLSRHPLQRTIARWVWPILVPHVQYRGVSNHFCMYSLCMFVFERAW